MSRLNSDDSQIPGTSAKVEVEEYLESRVVRRRLLPRAILVGLVSGSIAAAFRLALTGAENLREHAMAWAGQSCFGQAAFAALIAGAGTSIALAIGQIDKDSGGSGIPHMKAVLEGHSSMNWARLIAVKFSAAVVSIGSGLALGREGPTVQMGGAAGIAVADFTGATGREKRALTAAGAGSGLAAAFNAPLAGVTFVLEELQRDFQPVVFAAALLSAAVATVVSRLVSGQVPAFAVPTITTPSLAYLPLFLLIGALGGLLGVGFNRGLMDSSTRLRLLRNRSKVALSVGAGIVTGLVYLVSPTLLGGGHHLTESALHGQLLLGPAVVFLIVRLLFVHGSYGTGVPGGIFAPLLSLGALLGVIVFHLLGFVAPQNVSVAACAVAGMCALFSGVVRAPLTGIILIAEMTGSYELLLPLLASAFTAYAVAEALRDVPIYEALLQRDAAIKGWDLDDHELLTAEFEVKPDSSFDGKLVRDLRLPEGVLIVLCRTGTKEFVPRASTALHSHMRIVVATNSPSGFREVEAGVAPAA